MSVFNISKKNQVTAGRCCLNKETVEITILDLDEITDALRASLKYLEMTEAKKYKGKESYIYRKVRLALETIMHRR